MKNKKQLLNIFQYTQLLVYKLVSHFPGLIKNDRNFIEYIWKYRMNYPLNLDNPKTYNEKLQWMKLYDRNPLYTQYVDKFACKLLISKIIGKRYVIPTLGVWKSFDEIDFDSLPDQFVLKCTHDSGGIVICKDKKKLNIQAAKKKIRKAMKRDFWMAAREWPYKNVPRRIIAEKYMEDEKTKELRDYKFFCFDGEVKAMFVATERQRKEEPYFDFFTPDFNNMGIVQGHPNSPRKIEKPATFEEMKKIATKLSKGLPHVRVDLYDVNGKVYFGEMTFFHHTGMVPFVPNKWDKIFGDWLQLPNK